MNNSDPIKRTQLTSAGESRRSEMLGELKVELQHLQRRKRNMRTLVTALLVITMGGAIWSAWKLQPPPVTPEITTRDSIDPETLPPKQLAFKSSTTLLIQTVENRSDVLNKYLVRRSQPISTSRYSTINDQQLVQLLAEIGRPSVLGRVGGKLRLVRLDSP